MSCNSMYMNSLYRLDIHMHLVNDFFISYFNNSVNKLVNIRNFVLQSASINREREA